MNIKEIKELVKMLDGTDINELSIESEGNKVVIKKGTNNLPYMNPQFSPMVQFPMTATPDITQGGTAPAAANPAASVTTLCSCPSRAPFIGQTQRLTLTTSPIPHRPVESRDLKAPQDRQDPRDQLDPLVHRVPRGRLARKAQPVLQTLKGPPGPGLPVC